MQKMQLRLFYVLKPISLHFSNIFIFVFISILGTLPALYTVHAYPKSNTCYFKQKTIYLTKNQFSKQRLFLLAHQTPHISQIIHSEKKTDTQADYLSILLFYLFDCVYF